MSEEDIKKGVNLHEVTPAEQVGRDTIARYQSQFKAAAFECLSLLEDEELDRVYCDYQDDYVARYNSGDSYLYTFYQVKTKKKLNHQWSVNELTGMKNNAKTANVEKIASSFIGKLLVHTIKFKSSCGNVVFVTNIHVGDGVIDLIKSIESDGENQHHKLILESFNEAFIEDEPIDALEIVKLVKKLQMKTNVTYLTPNDDSFPAIARDAVYKYSEIDLKHGECEGILNNLISLVEKKSFKELCENISEADLDESAGIGLEDMLDILSISRSAYKKLKDGGDPQAIKNASIIYRLMNDSGASEPMIEYVSDCKVKWDIWMRSHRHTMADFDYNFLQEKIESIAQSWSKSVSMIKDLERIIVDLEEEIKNKEVSGTLDKNLLLGGVFSAVVRNEW